jgi:hypothetical protein
MVVGFQLRWFAVCLLTALIFPVLLWIGVRLDGDLIFYQGYALAGVAVRNALLLACTLSLLAGAADRRPHSLAAAGPALSEAAA